jgi:hypothetical protein
VKTAFGYAIPRSNNVGCDFASASYLAEATTPQTVAVSPMWPTASSGLREAAAVALAHSPTTLKTARSLDDLIAVLANADRVTRLRATVTDSL